MRISSSQKNKNKAPKKFLQSTMQKREVWRVSSELAAPHSQCSHKAKFDLNLKAEKYMENREGKQRDQNFRRHGDCLSLWRFLTATSAAGNATSQRPCGWALGLSPHICLRQVRMRGGQLQPAPPASIQVTIQLITFFFYTNHSFAMYFIIFFQCTPSLYELLCIS
ncbi:hypothetical protein PAHAL_5G350500 [Panicum hallii]|uniref:Uncharacterized protein n=1 Tax=Panicum hallii TaxID=206008 RepID=A0A2T8IM85_9POAL|nr:hypothetical protein PAHAL_5G350500 [Panicum hallii]